MKKSSIISRVIGSMLKLTKPSYMDSIKDANAFLKKSTPEFKSIFSTGEYQNMKFACFGDEKKKSRIIIYLHGGAYVNQMNFQHTLYCYILSHLLDAYVLAPAYPLIPECSYKDAVLTVLPFYKDVSEKYDKDIILMGDSAGGGFALSLICRLIQNGIRLPKNVVVFSPWVNVDMKGDYDSSDDPILGEVGLREFGRCWAGELETDDCRISPLFCNNFPPVRTLIFAGEDEIFYEDIKKFYEKIEDNGSGSRLVTGKGLYHIYPLFPIPEAVSSLKIIKKEIEDYKSRQLKTAKKDVGED